MEKIESMQDVYKIARRYKPDEAEKCYSSTKFVELPT